MTIQQISRIDNLWSVTNVPCLKNSDIQYFLNKRSAIAYTQGRDLETDFEIVKTVRRYSQFEFYKFPVYNLILPKQPIIFSNQNELKIMNIRHVYVGKNRTKSNQYTYFDLYELSNDSKTWIKHSTEWVAGFLKTQNGILKKLAKKYQ